MIAKGTRSGLSNVEVSGAYITCFYTFDVVRDGPLEKLWGGGGGAGNFRAAGIFFL